MNLFTGFFLRAKHGVIFLLLCGIWFVGDLISMGWLSTAVQTHENSLKTAIAIGVVTGLCLFVYLAWLWSIGSFLTSIAPPTLRPRLGFLTFSSIYPCVYVIIAAPFFTNGELGLFAIIIPLHLLAMLCIFYDLRFVSKNLSTVESGRRVSLYDYAGPFFLLWFFPVGIWIIQPRINQLYGERSATESIRRD